MRWALPWMIGCAAAAIAVVVWATGSAQGDAGFIAFLGLIGVGLIARSIRTPADEEWLVSVVALAYLAKIVASLARYAVLMVLYDGIGDATGYHQFGIELVHAWRSLEAPPMDIGTQVVRAITGLFYVPYVPTMLGGFFIFATIAFLGQLLFYAAFRRSVAPRRLPWYAAAVFFLPAIVYWPSSIGKESLMYLFIGLAAYGAAGLFRAFRPAWLALFAVGVAGCAVIRPHIAVLLTVALVLTLVISRWRAASGRVWRRILAIGGVAIVLLVAGNLAVRWFGLDLTSGSDIFNQAESVVANVEQNTAQGGSIAKGGRITTPLEFPAGFLKVMFRPLPYEAHNLQALASSLEASLILVLVLWRLVPMIRNSWRIRRDPYLMFAALFTLGFVVAFSSFNNLGLMARERAQVMPFFIALVVGLGWSIGGPGEPAQDRRDRQHVPAGS